MNNSEITALEKVKAQMREENTTDETGMSSKQRPPALLASSVVDFSERVLSSPDDGAFETE